MIAAASGGAMKIDISGTAMGDELIFSTFISNGEGIDGDLKCLATLEDNRSRMTGSFKHASFNPLQCDADCKGGWGEFDMQRIVEAG